MSTTSSAARELALHASFQAFANCYLREVDAGRWHTAASWQASSGVALERGETHVVELELESQDQLLALGVGFRSCVGRHALTQAHRQRRHHQHWQRIDGLTAQLALIDALYAAEPESAQRLELIGRLIESHQVMASYAQRQLADPARGHAAQDGSASFIASEQSVVLGHWLHPTPKSRQGMHGFQHDHYAPELEGRFQLSFFAADRALVQQASILDVSAEAISQRLAGHGARAGDGYCLLPVHPLQAEWLVHQDYVRALLAERRLIDLGRLGPLFTATSSVRTVFCESERFMLKLSIPVKITNSLRINLRTELGDSVWISQLLRACAIAQAFPKLRAIEDPAYITLQLPDREESGFEVIFRANPFHAQAPSAHETVHSIAALTQDPLAEGRSSVLAQLVRRFASAAQLSLEVAARRWFDAYFACAVEAPIRVYDRHGIALEAHQQNVLLELDRAGLPRYAYCRDLQGLALSACCRDELIARVPQLAQQPKVFEPVEIVRNGLGYYLFFNQLYAVIHRFALDGLLDEETLLGTVRHKLAELRPSMRALGTALIDMLLDAKAVPCKANLLTRVADMDELEAESELAVYTRVENPLRPARRAAVHPPRGALQLERS